MFVVRVKNPEGETMELLSTPDENFAAGAQAGVAALLKLLEHDLEFEEGYTCESSRQFDVNPTQWNHVPKKNS